MLKIRDFAKLADVSMTTLRYYDEIGLLKPIHVDSENGYRFYSIDQLPQLHRILAFKELGLELNQIIEILNEGVSPEVMQGMLRFKRSQIQQRIQAEQEQLVRIEARLQLLERGSDMPVYDVVLKPVKSISGVSLRLASSDFVHVTHWVDPVEAILERYNIRPIDHLVVLHPDADNNDAFSFVEIVAPVHWKDANVLTTAHEGQLTRCSLPALPQVASTLHQGPPTLMLAAYQALGAWMEHHGYTIVGPRRKIRLRRGNNLDEALTEIQFPVEKVGHD